MNIKQKAEVAHLENVLDGPKVPICLVDQKH